MRFNKRFTAIFILLLWPSLVPLQAGPIGSPGQRPPPGVQSQEGEQGQSSDQAQQDDAKGKSQDLKRKARRSKQAGQQVRQTLTAHERKQFEAISRLAKKAAYHAQARKQLQVKWHVFVKGQARKKGKMNINTLVQAAMYEAWQEQEQALRKALLNVQKANKQKQQLSAELKRARHHQQKMKTQQGRMPIYQPARIKGVKGSTPIRTQAQMSTLITGMKNNMSTMGKNSQLMMMALQNQMQQQAQMMQMMSNIMKMMHDTAQSVIRNLR